MNQILNDQKNESISTSSHDLSPKNKKKFLLLFFISIFICIFSIFIYISLKYQLSEKEKISKSLMQQFSITTLYANTTNSVVADKITESSDISSPFVIGLIEIDKIKLLYPILSHTTEELLKISPCRYAGPLPNEIGNLCIAGHNYVDNKLFSKVHLLQIDDVIKIYDLSGNVNTYSVYDKTEVEIEDISCTSQDTNGEKIITLITCNNVKGTRVIVKAKENR